MPLVLKDRVKETSSTTGTGTLTLAGASTGFQSFSVIGNGNTTYYAIYDRTNQGWEVGVGTYSSGTLTRDTVLESSNSGNKVDFPAGTRDVFCTYPAEQAVTLDDVQTLTNKTLTSPTIAGGSINNTVIGNTTPNAATFTTLSTGALTATGQTSLGGAAGSESLRVVTPSSAPNAYVKVFGSPFGFGYITTDGSAASSGLLLSSKGGASASIYTNNFSQEHLRVTHTASAVNYVQVTGATTGNGVTLSSQGSDANINMFYTTKGTGGHVFYTNAGVNGRQFDILHTTNAVNRATVTGSATNFEPVWGVAGSDTNISMAFQSKGTGGISLSTGSTGTNLVNGTSVTAITRTAAGSGYTSAPSVAISAPTTAGGVQATASVTAMLAGNPTTVQVGGTGYTVNDTLTVVGGTPTGVAATYTVTAVSGGVVTAVTALNFASYSVLPTNPVTTTGGTGSGCTLNLTYGVAAGQPTITNAGSGYVEQPTVTFSGGGGSGAAAYASIGSTPRLTSLANTLDFYVASSVPSAAPAFQIQDGGGSGTYIRAITGPSGAFPAFFSTGSTNVNMAMITSGTGEFRFSTSSGSASQFRVAHTASAVNYVQVTGATTGNLPTISAQGSDAAISLAYAAKGVASHRFQTNGGEVLRIAQFGSTAPVNRLEMFGGTSGFSTLVQSGGSDTNVNLEFGTKAAGLFSFKTNTPSNGTGAEQLRVTHTASAVNYVQVTGAATSNNVNISAQGSDTNIGLTVASKGTGFIFLNNTTQVPLSAANRFQFSGANAGSTPSILTVGSDTNIDLALTPKGTGLVRFGTYTGTALTIAGYIEIKDSGGTVRKLAVVA